MSIKRGSTENARPETHQLEVAGIPVEVVRKPIKHLHVGVYPPDGHVRVSAPERLDNEAVRLAIVSRLSWVRRQQAEYAAQPRQSSRRMLSGESHYVWGRRYRLNVIRHTGANRVAPRPSGDLDLYVRPSADAKRRRSILTEWYRDELKDRIPPLIETWEPRLGVSVSDWGVKRMRTKWGTCNARARRIWLNLELAKKPPECLEFVVVHEMAHLLERSHNDQFVALMDEHLPTWRSRRRNLNASPLADETW